MSTGQAAQQAQDVKPTVDNEGGSVIELIGKGDNVFLWDPDRKKYESEFYLKIGANVCFRSTVTFTVTFKTSPPPVEVDQGIGSANGSVFTAKQVNHTLPYWLQLKTLTTPGTGLKSNDQHPNGKQYQYNVSLGGGQSSDPDMDIVC